MKSFISTYTKINDFNICPRRFWLIHGSKYINGKPEIPFQTSEPLRIGGHKHDLMASAAESLKNKYTIPTAVQSDPYWKTWWGDVLRQLITLHKDFLVEHKIGMCSAWRGWALKEYYALVAPEIFYRENRVMIFQGAFDLILFDRPWASDPEKALIIDWKSGRKRPYDRMGQLAMYAAMAFCYWPSLESVDTSYVYLDAEIGDSVVESFSRADDLPAIQDHITGQVANIMLAFSRLSSVDAKTAFFEKPGSCHWCPADGAQCSRKG